MHLSLGFRDFGVYKNAKEKLILELEKSQRKMLSMKHHYEDKLTQLQFKINEIETERDQVLAKLTNLGSTGDEKAKKVRDEYQKKLNLLQNEKLTKLSIIMIKNQK